MLSTDERMIAFGTMVKPLSCIVTISLEIRRPAVQPLHQEAEHAFRIRCVFHDRLNLTADETFDVALAVATLAANLYLLEYAVLVPTVERHLGNGQQL